jgi:hypothetical protein
MMIALLAGRHVILLLALRKESIPSLFRLPADVADRANVSTAPRAASSS